MNLCIPTQEDQGLASKIHEHFGSAPFLALVDAATLEVEFLSNQGGPHQAGGCQGSALGSRPVDAVFCHKMGRGALASLEGIGIPVYVTTALTLSEALQAILQGEVQRMQAGGNCKGHGHSHEHGGQCCGGR